MFIVCESLAPGRRPSRIHDEGGKETLQQLSQTIVAWVRADKIERFFALRVIDLGDCAHPADAERLVDPLGKLLNGRESEDIAKPDVNSEVSA